LSNGKLDSLITIVKWGRNIIANIKKIIIYQTTINLVALTMAFIGGIINK
jgi:Ca2+ transporting ATPase